MKGHALPKFGLTLAASLLGTALFGEVNQVKAQQAPSPPQVSAAGAAGENNGEDFTRPQNLIQLRYLYQTAPGSGSVPSTIRSVTTDTATLRADLKFDLRSQWQVWLRGDLPISAKNPITSENPAGEYVYGLGDADVQAAIVKQLDARWAAGAGLRIVAPTGAPDITSGKWQALPIVGARAMLPEISPGSFFTALVRYNEGFAGPSSKNISNLQMAPTLNINLPGHWFFTFYPSPDIRINYGDPVTGQTGRLFLPLDFMAGHVIGRNITVSLEISTPLIKDYPVYDFKTVARLNVSF